MLLELPSEPETSGKLNSVIRYVHGQDDCDIATGFSSVAIQAARSLASLLDPRDTLGSCGRRSLLSRVDQVTRGILSVTALDSVSEIVSDRLDVLATV